MGEVESALELVVVGGVEDPRVQAALLAFQGRPDFHAQWLAELPLSMASLTGNARLLLVCLDGLEERARLQGIHRLAQQGAQVICLLGRELPALRAVAFTAGAADVLLPPFDPQRIEGCATSLLGLTVRRGIGCRPEIPLELLVDDPAGRSTVTAGAVLQLSRVGFFARVDAVPGAPGTVARATLTLPAPFSLGTVFVRLQGTEEDGGRPLLRARFLGLFPKESETVSALVDRLAGERTDPLGALEILADMDAARLREQIDGFVAGVKVPPLTAYEKAGLAAAPGSPASPFATVALARARATMMAQVVLKAAQAGGLPRIEELNRRWNHEIEAARGVLREEIARRVAAKQQLAVKELRDTLTRLDSAADQVERALTDATAEVPKVLIQEVSTPVRFDKPPEPAPAPSVAPGSPAAASRGKGVRRARIALLGAGLALGATALAALQVDTHQRRAVDPATVIELPVVDRKIGKIGIRSVYDDKQWSIRYVVVDAGWFKSNDEEHLHAVWTLMKDLKLPKDWRLGVKDLDGHFLTDCRWPTPTPVATTAASSGTPRPLPAATPR